MKKKILFVVIIFVLTTFALIGCTPNDIQKPSGGFLDLSGMSVVFEDDFNDGFDSNAWSIDRYWDSDHEYIRRGGYWDIDQCTPDKLGNLVMRTEYKTDGKYGSGYYTGMLNTRGRKEFTYGYFEVRCKAPKAQGLWAAFWMLSDTYSTVSGDGHGGAEIDIMESPYYNDPGMPAKHYRNTTFHTVHIDGYLNDHKSQTSPKYEVQNDIYDTFNTYGLLWTEDEYVFYINGVESWRTTFGVSDSPQYLILSIEIAGEHSKVKADPSNPDNKYCWAGQIQDNPAELLPADFVIDYVKVYQ